MKLITDTNLNDLTYEGRAADTFMNLTEYQLHLLDKSIEAMYPEGITKEQVDMLLGTCVDCFVADQLGFDSWEEVKEYNAWCTEGMSYGVREYDPDHVGWYDPTYEPTADDLKRWILRGARNGWLYA